MLNWCNFVKSQPNYIFFLGWGEDILNIACKLISTILRNWHYLVVWQHNSWANFILRQHRKRTILFLQGSVGTRNRCNICICIVLLGIYSRASLPKIIKFGWNFTKLCRFNIKQIEMCSFWATLYSRSTFFAFFGQGYGDRRLTAGIIDHRWDLTLTAEVGRIDWYARDERTRPGTVARYDWTV